MIERIYQYPKVMSDASCLLQSRSTVYRSVEQVDVWYVQMMYGRSLLCDEWTNELYWLSFRLLIYCEINNLSRIIEKKETNWLLRLVVSGVVVSLLNYWFKKWWSFFPYVSKMQNLRIVMNERHTSDCASWERPNTISHYFSVENLYGPFLTLCSSFRVRWCSVLKLFWWCPF